jgi:hypothetical protein
VKTKEDITLAYVHKILLKLSKKPQINPQAGGGIKDLKRKRERERETEKRKWVVV